MTEKERTIEKERTMQAHCRMLQNNTPTRTGKNGINLYSLRNQL